jgi:4-carboxymuconolactone decarboxylase
MSRLRRWIGRRCRRLALVGGLTLCVTIPWAAIAQTKSLSLEEMRSVSPALASYTESLLIGDLWKRPGLSPRDRSLVTVAALIARNQQSEMPFHFRLALDNGVTPAELSETITHLAFYAGWGNATSAASIAHDVFLERRVTVDQLPDANPKLLSIDKAAEEKRASFVASLAGDIAPGVVHYTDRLFHDLWLRPGLSPRDRSLVTISALIANGQGGQLAAHLQRGLANGLTREQVGEALTHLEFYAGWPTVFSALPIVKNVLENKPSNKVSHD